MNIIDALKESQKRGYVPIMRKKWTFKADTDYQQYAILPSPTPAGLFEMARYYGANTEASYHMMPNWRPHFDDLVADDWVLENETQR